VSDSAENDARSTVAVVLSAGGAVIDLSAEPMPPQHALYQDTDPHAPYYDPDPTRPIPPAKG
jgi:hypothetical protein